jgi:hypothetical protein
MPRIFRGSCSSDSSGRKNRAASAGVVIPRAARSRPTTGGSPAARARTSPGSEGRAVSFETRFETTLAREFMSTIVGRW